MTLPKVLVIILQYNNSSLTVKCLESVSRSDYPNFEVVVVDNNSRPDHAQAIEKAIARFGARYKFIASDKNLGYSGGNNLGIKRGLQNDVEYFLILNNDVVIGEDLISKLVERIEYDGRLGIIAPAVDENEKVACGGKIEWLRSELSHIYGSDEKFAGASNNLKIYVPGMAMMVRRAVFEKIGLLDEKYFLYFEDADFSERTARAGFAIEIHPELIVWHETSSTTRRFGSPLLLRYHFRNAHLFNWKYAPFWIKILLPFWSIFIIIKQGIKMLILPYKRGVSRFIISGVMDFYLGRWGEIK
jgi:GT2 family glycosyltransferase